MTTRPLRSLLLGDTDHYFSPYVFGVAQGCHALGLWHSQMSLRQPPGVLLRRVLDVRPDLLWLHMGLWPPTPKVTNVEHIAGICRRAMSFGAKVLLHDGDVKPRTRYPQDVSGFVSLALCNHRHPRAEWNIPTLYWPYAAFLQDDIAPARDDLRCDLAFAGKAAKGIYDQRSRMVQQLRERLDMKVYDPAEANTMFLTPEIASSSTAVLGFGRPDQADWIDTRVFQYPGAGGILLHDDVKGFLEPWRQYVPYKTGDIESVVEAVQRLKTMDEKERWYIREEAFHYIQLHQTWTARVREVLKTLEVG